MYFINNPEKCVESIIKTADKNSLLKLLLKEAAKKYSVGKCKNMTKNLKEVCYE